MSKCCCLYEDPDLNAVQCSDKKQASDWIEEILVGETSWKGEGYISVVEVIFALSLSTSAAANNLVDDDDDGPILTPLVSSRDVNFFQ